MKHIVSIIAFMVVSFAVQGLSHFILNQEYYDTIEFMRAEPILAMGILAMVIQGAILTISYEKVFENAPGVKTGLLHSISFGLFLWAYIGLAEPAKYTAPSIFQWMIVEGSASLVQFILYGILLGIIHLRLRKTMH